LSAGLATTGELIGELVADFDWAFATACLTADGCNVLSPVTTAGKAALVIEYGDAQDAEAICQAARGTQLDVLVKRPSLDAFRVGCTEAP
jgi:hypothetical protein